MIAIRDLPLNVVSEIDELLGYRWRDGKLLKSELSDGCVDVHLQDNVILKTSNDSDLYLDLGGKKATINLGDYSEVQIL